MDTIPEMNGPYAPENSKLLSAEEVADYMKHEDEEDFMEDPMVDYAYKQGEFVAVIDEDGDHGEFWIAKVKEVRGNSLGWRKNSL